MVTTDDSLRILIVEDQLLIAKQLELVASMAGHSVVATATTKQAACDLALRTKPDLAFVDISLADGCSGIDIAAFMVETCATQVIFTTANARRLPHDFCGAIGVVEKPFTSSGLVAALDFVAARLSERDRAVCLPISLQLSPAYEAIWVGDLVSP